MKKCLLFVLLLLLPFTFCLTVEQGTIFNTSISNSSINFSSSFNITNLSIESNYVYLYNITLVNSTGYYECGNKNHSTENSVFSSSDFNCTLNSVTSEVIEETNSGNYLKEGYSDGSLKLHVKLGRKNTRELKLERELFDIVNLKITAKRSLYGDIEIKETDLIDSLCKDQLEDNYKIYKILEIEHEFDTDKTENVELDIRINETWINKNNISKIKTERCSLVNENLETTLVNSKESVYNIKSQGFSTWVIYGLPDEPPILKEKTEVINKTEEIINEIDKETNSYLEELISIAIILVMILILLKGKKKKHKRNKQKKKKN